MDVFFWFLYGVLIVQEGGLQPLFGLVARDAFSLVLNLGESVKRDIVHLDFAVRGIIILIYAMRKQLDWLQADQSCDGVAPRRVEEEHGIFAAGVLCGCCPVPRDSSNVTKAK